MVDFEKTLELHNTGGHYSRFHPVHKFGFNPALASNGYESIWTEGGLYPWSAFDGNAKAIFVKSTDNGDTGEITVEGLDGNYNKLVETVTMTGTTALQLSGTFKRVFRAHYVDGSHAGDITIHAETATGTVVAAITNGLQQTQMAVYTIPAGFTGYLRQTTYSCGKNDDATVRLFTRHFGNSFQVETEGKVYQSSFTQNFSNFIKLPAKTDIDVRAITTSAGSELIANFDLVIIDGR